MADVATSYDKNLGNKPSLIDDRQTASTLRRDKLQARRQRAETLPDQPVMTRDSKSLNRPAVTDANRVLNQPLVRTQLSTATNDNQDFPDSPTLPRRATNRPQFANSQESDSTEDYTDESEADLDDESGAEANVAGKTGTWQTIKALKQAAKKQREAEVKAASDQSGDASKIDDLVDRSFGMMTDDLLRQSWLNLIPSWGTTLIYIDCHAFLSFVLGESYFCKLGHEWASMVGGKAGASAGAGAQAESQIVSTQMTAVIEQAGDKIGLIEIMTLIIIHILLFVIILALIFLITLLAYVVSHPVQSAIDFFGVTAQIFYNYIF